MNAGLPSMLTETPPNPMGSDAPFGLTVAVAADKFVPRIDAQPPDEIFPPKAAPSTTLVITGPAAADVTLTLNESGGKFPADAITVANPGALPAITLVLACPEEFVGIDAGFAVASPAAKLTRTPATGFRVASTTPATSGWATAPFTA